MGIADQIRKTIQEILFLKFCPAESNSDQTAFCILCKSNFIISGNFSFFIPDEGHVCYGCGRNFAPDMADALNHIIHCGKTDMAMRGANDILSTQEWQQIYQNLETLQQVSLDLIKGLSRGIVEAPAGHIGLLYFAKDLVRPVKKEGEPEKEYQLRVKTYRISKIYEKLKTETIDRLELLHDYLIRLGMPVPKDRGR